MNFVMMGGRRQVGGIVVVAEQGDYIIIDGNDRGSNSDSCPCLRLNVFAYRHHGGPKDVAASMERWNPGFLNSVLIGKSRDLIAPHLFAGTRKFDNWAQLEQRYDSEHMMNTRMMSS